MKAYQWEIGSFFGTLKARNLKEATIKAVRHYFENVPYPPDTITRMDILVKEIKETD